MRLFRVINDFYKIKNDGWNYQDLLLMQSAIRTVGLDPECEISLNVFIDSLIDEIHQDSVGFDSYGESITLFSPQEADDYSKFVVENISSPVFTSLHGLKIQYKDRLEMVEVLSGQLQITQTDALKMLLRQSIANMGVNLDYQFPLAETAIEILGCIRLAEKLAGPQQLLPQAEKTDATNHKIVVSSPTFSEVTAKDLLKFVEPFTKKIAANIHPYSDFQNDLGLNHGDMVDFIRCMENIFHIKINDWEIPMITNANLAADFINATRKANKGDVHPWSRPDKDRNQLRPF